ncbi:MAG: hypothetical protein RLZ98_2105 [Pseudomonadota bacterium]|jgi:uncharacterized protein (TIGR00730 family)
MQKNIREEAVDANAAGARDARKLAGTAKAAAKPADGPLISNICVYCGSGSGSVPIYADAARTLGRSLAEAGIGLVYGGGSLGLMGEVARTTLEHGGHVTGIIPDFLIAREKMLKDVNELIVTGDMHERKMKMFEKSDAFVALPGGIGTLEELVEQLTWSQLGQHTKPIILTNIDGFWQPFITLLAHMREQHFIRAGLEVSFETVNKVEDVIPAALRIARERGVVEKTETVRENF